jgi:O-antigen/teichoic acid export membrane protein
MAADAGPIMIEPPVSTLEQRIAAETAVLRSAGLTLTGMAAGGAIAFANEIMIARYMGARTYGLFALAVVLARIGNGLALFGLGAAVLHYLPIYRRRGERARVVGTVFEALLLPLLLGVAAAALLWVIAPWLATQVFRKAEAVPYLRLLALAVPFMAISEILALIARGLGFSSHYVLISNLTAPVALIALLSVIRLREADPIWIAAAIAGAYGVAALLGVLLVMRTVGTDFWRLRPEFDVGTLYCYAIPVLLGTCVYLVMEWADILILGRFVSADQVGVYRACTQICVIFDMIILATNLAAAHIFPVLDDEKRSRECNEMYRHVTLVVALLSTPTFFLLSLQAEHVLALLGPNFTKASLVLIILAGGRLIRNGLGTSAFLLVLSGRQGAEMRNAAIGGSANIILNLALIPSLGVLGAAIGTTVAEVALNLLRTWQMRRLMDVPVPWRLLARIALVGVTGAAAVSALTPFVGLDQSRPAALLVNSVAAAAVFGISLWFLAVEQRDRTAIMRVFQ